MPNPYHDERGRFATGPGGGGAGRYSGVMSGDNRAAAAAKKAEKPADYGMQHRPPSPDYGAPLNDLTAGGLLPEDVYTHPKFYDFAGDGAVLQNWRVFNSVRGKPNALVTVYRSLPHGHSNINQGDWVALRSAYARQEGVHSTDPRKDMPVIAALVHAKDVYSNGDSFDEFGYWGPTISGVRVPKRRR